MDLLDEIKEEYIKGSMSYRMLCEKFKVSYAELTKRARAEAWVEQRNAFRGRNVEKRLDDLTLCLVEKLEKAIDQLDDHVTTIRVKEKSIEYDSDGKKAVSERVVESEELHIEKGPIDRAALKQLVGTLKELKGKDEITEADGIEVILADEAKELAL